jgi:hypothetical protein
MSIQIARETEIWIVKEALRQGISVDELLKRLMNEHVRLSPANGSVPELPVMHLGTMGPLHRRDIYNDNDVH